MVVEDGLGGGESRVGRVCVVWADAMGEERRLFDRHAARALTQVAGTPAPPTAQRRLALSGETIQLRDSQLLLLATSALALIAPPPHTTRHSRVGVGNGGGGGGEEEVEEKEEEEERQRMGTSEGRLGRIPVSLEFSLEFSLEYLLRRDYASVNSNPRSSLSPPPLLPHLSSSPQSLSPTKTTLLPSLP